MRQQEGAQERRHAESIPDHDGEQQADQYPLLDDEDRGRRRDRERVTSVHSERRLGDDLPVVPDRLPDQIPTQDEPRYGEVNRGAAGLVAKVVDEHQESAPL